MNRRSQTAERIQDRFRLVPQIWIPIAFLIFTFLVGGGSRSDMSSLPFLRGAAILFACWAITGMQSEDWRRIRLPLALLLAATAWIAIQLIPLPPSVWHGLPGRETIVAIDRLLNQADLWRPISLTPSETWNSLLAMTVPLAAILVAARLGPDDLRPLMLTLVALAVGSALLGIVQIISGAEGAYLYRIANNGWMIGLFANRNHHAIFQACAVIVVAMLLRDELMRRRQYKSLQLALVFAGVLSTAMTVLIGSRTGLAAGVFAFAAGYAMLVPAMQARSAGHREGSSKLKASGVSQWFVYAPPVILALLMATIIFLTDRTTAISRVADNQIADDLRVLAWPSTQKMLETYWTAGSGLGSFPDVYRIFEADSLLSPSYFNRAHNDWVEVAITGGLPLILILAATLFWFFRIVAQKGVRNLIKGHRGDYRLPVLLVVGVMAAASIVDYPLRIPSLQVMTILLIMIFACPTPATAQRE